MFAERQKKRRQCTYNVKLWRVPVTIAAVETKMLSVCVVELHDAVSYITKLFASFCHFLITRLWFLTVLLLGFCFVHFMYDGESKSKGKIHLTALVEVTVSNFTYHFSTQSPCNTMHLLYLSTSFCIPAEKKLFGCAMLMADQNDLLQ